MSSLACIYLLLSVMFNWDLCWVFSICIFLRKLHIWFSCQNAFSKLVN
jgi:hypothetical protein